MSTNTVDNLKFEAQEVKFELKQEFQNGARVWKVEFIHPTITGNGREYSKEELTLAARGWSYRPLNINHDRNRWLEYDWKNPTAPGSNTTLTVDYDQQKDSVFGEIMISDARTNLALAEQKIQKVSIEQIPYKGESCACAPSGGSCKCVQHGVIGTALALLETYLGVQPGDPKTKITSESCSCQQNKEKDNAGGQANKNDPDDDGDDDDNDPKDKNDATKKKSKQEENGSSLENKQNETAQMSASPSNTNEKKVESTNVQAQPTINLDLAPLVNEFKNSQQLQLEKLSELIGIIKPKQEAVKSEASKVAVDANQVYFESTVSKPAKFFSDVKNNVDTVEGFCTWTLKKEEYLASLQRGILRHQAGGTKTEAISITSGDKPQVFDKQLLILPGGRMQVPIRQYLNVKVIEGNGDRINFYKGDVFDVDDTTAEGTEGTNKTNTITKVQVVPALKRANQTINYADIEDMPQDLVQYVNQSAMIGALQVENKEVLDTTYSAITPTYWVRGDTGDALSTSDDVSGVAGLKVDGIMAALEYLESEGHDTSAGRCVLFASPHAVRQLMISVKTDYFTQDASLTQRDLGVIERRLGIDIVPINTVHKTSGATNTNCYQNVLAVKGEALGLAVAANLQMEAQRRPDLSAVKIGARHRIKGTVIDEKRTVRISTSTA